MSNNIDKFYKDLIYIDPGAKCLKFLYDRVLRDDYRGMHKLQHYRLSTKYIKIVLKYLPENDYLYHTKGDINTDYRYEIEEIPFAKYIKSVQYELLKEKEGSITDNGMRKIIFVNLQRMGFIDRFDKNKKLCDPYKKNSYRYVKITQKGLDLLNAKNIFEEQKIIGESLDFLFGGIVQDILDILNSLNKQYLGVDEMMFFVSYLRKDYQNNILTKDDIVDFIEEFRNLNSRKEIVTSVISDFCNPSKFKGTKTDKRDFHNWKNEAQTIFDGLDLMSIFEYDEKSQRLFLKVNINGNNIEFKRSSVIKKEYFDNHKICKDICFELHHIIPFYLAKDINMLKAIDHWKNLIYIDSNSHSLLTRNKYGKFAIRLSFNNNNVVLDNLIGFNQEFIYDKQVKYNTLLKKIMLEYNESLIK